MYMIGLAWLPCSAPPLTAAVRLSSWMYQGRAAALLCTAHAAPPAPPAGRGRRHQGGAAGGAAGGRAPAARALPPRQLAPRQHRRAAPGAHPAQRVCQAGRRGVGQVAAARVARAVQPGLPAGGGAGACWVLRQRRPAPVGRPCGGGCCAGQVPLLRAAKGVWDMEGGWVWVEQTSRAGARWSMPGRRCMAPRLHTGRPAAGPPRAPPCLPDTTSSHTCIYFPVAVPCPAAGPGDH